MITTLRDSTCPASDRPRAAKNILLLVPLEHGYARHIADGVLDYAANHAEWHFLPFHDPFGLPPSMLADADGIIATRLSPAVRRAARRRNVAVVLIRPPFANTVTVDVDQHAFGRMALMHFVDLGISRFAACGYASVEHHAWRIDGFVRSVQTELSLDTAVRVVPERPLQGRSRTFSASLLHAWGPFLSSLPRPIGVFTPDTAVAGDVLTTCRALSLEVPEMVAVIACGESDLSCRLCSPPLTAVDGGGNQLGFAAAERLSRLLRGEAVVPAHLALQPLRVVARRSTDVLAVPDADVAKAVGVIRDEAASGLTVAELCARISSVSRRTLERRFRAIFHRSIQEEIDRVRMAHARSLLLDTDLLLERVAERSGFATASHFVRAFMRQFRVTPGEFRRRSSTWKGSAG